MEKKSYREIVDWLTENTEINTNFQACPCAEDAGTAAEWFACYISWDAPVPYECKCNGTGIIGRVKLESVSNG